MSKKRKTITIIVAIDTRWGNEEIKIKVPASYTDKDIDEEAEAIFARYASYGWRK